MGKLVKQSSPCVQFTTLGLYLALILLVFRTISLNCSETIILTPKDFSKIKIKFDFAEAPSNDETRSVGDQFGTTGSVPKEWPKRELTTEDIRIAIEQKLVQLKAYLGQESATNTSVSSNDVVQLQPVSLMVNNAEMRVNMSLDTISISGLSRFTTSDIAINDKSKKASALLRFPDMRIELFYKVAGWRLHSNQSKQMRAYTDKGKVVYVMRGWRTMFSGKMINIVNRTRLEIAGFGMRSHYDLFETQVHSFMHSEKTSSPMGDVLDIPKFISNTLMKTSINNVDDRLETILLDELDVHEMTTWANLRDQSSEDGQMMMMESKVFESRTSSRRRQKRQVPCETGEELDEYVDSLFRFLRRLVRVMEPFSLPNVTIELEDYNLQIFLHSGGATRAYTFERKRPAWVLCRNETTSLGLTVGIEDARVMYKYRVIQDWRLLFDGDLEAQIRKAKAQVQLTQLNPPEEDENAEPTDDEGEEEQQVQQRIDKLKVWKPGQIVVLIRGLGNLSSAMSMLVNQMLSDPATLEPIIGMVETDGVVAANDLLKNVSIPIFSII